MLTAALLHEGVDDEELVAAVADDPALPNRQLRLFSQPQPSPLSTAELLQIGVLLLPELADAEALPAPKRQLRLFSQPQPLPLSTALAEQKGRLADETQDRPFSKPQPFESTDTLAEQVGFADAVGAKPRELKMSNIAEKRPLDITLNIIRDIK